MSDGAKWTLLALAVAGCVGYLVFSATRGTAEYYQTIPEARADLSSAADVRILGTVQPGVKRSDGGQQVLFTVKGGGQTLPVEYRGPLPDIFRPGIQVVLDGHTSSSGVFEAASLLAKCPSRFTTGHPNSSA